jgi:hypothetical protein
VTLWAVRTVDPGGDGSLDVYYPVATREDGEESAGRVNSWIADMQDRHPDLGLTLAASVIEWPESDEAHAIALAEQRQREMDLGELEEAE